MKRILILLAVALVAGVAAFCFTRSHKMAERQELRLDAMPELTWIRTDLKLTDEQCAKVSALHVAYRPKCEEMCSRISKAHEKVVAAARRDGAMTPELESAIREHADTHAQCQQAMLRHMYETAAVLDEEQAKRYLETMLPVALDFTAAESGHTPSH